MKFFLLANSELPYVWPETTISTVLQVCIFVVLFILVIMVARLIFLQKKNTSHSWTHILSYAYNKKLASKEISILEHFFNSLELSVNEKAKLLNDKKTFELYLYSYLKKFHSDSVESHVRILDKLFPASVSMSDFKSLMDINVGEVCAIEFEGAYFLSRVMNRTFREILLSVHDSALKKEKEGSSVNLYFYRNNIGGYLIPGFVKKINANGILFFQDGDIQVKGEEHLVANITKDILLFPWGLNTPDSKLGLHDKDERLSDDDKKSIEEEDKSNASTIDFNLTAKMLKLSDRAVLLTLEDKTFSEAVLNKIDIWEMPLDISTIAIPLILKGKLMKSSNTPESYVFKFIGPSETDVKAIFDEIKKHSPVRGYIS